MQTTSLRHHTTKTVQKGSYYPLGASLTPSGVNFALYSKHATEVFLLLFEPAEGEPTDIMQLQHRTKFIWHCFVPGFRAGQLYGYKVRGEYRPEWGCALMRQSSSSIRTPRLLPGSFATLITYTCSLVVFWVMT